MTKQEAFRLVGGIDGRFVEEAEAYSPQKKRVLPYRVIAAAACVCLIGAGILALPKMLRLEDNVSAEPAARSDAQEWSAAMNAADYFKNCAGSDEMTESASASLVMPPYAAAVSWNDMRERLEAEGILPPMPEHREQHFEAEYNGDGTLYKVFFLWMRRSENGLEGYSDLTLTAAPEEIREIDDVIAVPLDEFGNEIPAGVTLTVRDGVLIAAEGGEGQAKTLTWRTEAGWYRIGGSWNDSYEDVVALFDWFWEHPLDPGLFAEPREGSMLFSTREEYPEAFREQIPDFAALGYAAESELVNLAARYDGETAPVWFEGVYTRGGTRIRWTISAGADKDDFDACLGFPERITEDMVGDALAEGDFFNIEFIADIPSMATVRLEEGTPADVWEIVRSLRN